MPYGPPIHVQGACNKLSYNLNLIFKTSFGGFGQLYAYKLLALTGVKRPYSTCCEVL